MKKTSIGVKFAFLSLLVVFCIVSISGSLLFYMQGTMLAQHLAQDKALSLERLNLKADNLLNFIAKIAPEAIRAYDFETLSIYVNEIMKDPEVIDAQIVNMKGKRLDRFLGQFPQVIDSGKVNKDSIRKKRRIVHYGKKLGFVEIYLSKDIVNRHAAQLESETQAQMKRLLFSFVGINIFGILFLVVGTIVIFRKVVVDRLAIVLDFFNLIGEGEWSKRIAYMSGKQAFDELDELGDGFNQMIDNLQTTTASRDKLNDLNEQLKVNEQKFRSVFEHSAVSITIVDSNERIVSWNKFTEALLGMGYEDLNMRAVSSLYPAEDWQMIRQYEIRKSGFKENIETHVVHKDGRSIEVELSVTVLKDNQGKMTGAIGLLKNITERKDAERELQRLKSEAEGAAKSKAEFLANMSHEIRTPMNSILGFSDVLSRTDLQEKQKKYVDLIRSSGELLLGIINDILDLSKLESGKIEFEQIDFNVMYLLNDVFKMLTHRMKDRPIDTYIDVADDVPADLKGDPTRLRQIFINLLGNSIKFTPKGSIGVIVTRDPEGTEDFPRLRFVVKDTGVGIPKDRVETVFEAFSQADSSTTRKFGGTGLGLTITRNLVQAMGGDIGMESEVGKGSEFCFTLSLQKGDAFLRQKIYPLRSDDLKGLPVFIVDDNEIARNLLVKNFELMGMDIVGVADSALSGFERLKKLYVENRFPELIVSDIIMSEMDGYEFVEKIRANENFKDVKVIAISSDPKIGEADNAKVKGFDASLPKPVILEELVKVVSTVLGDRRNDKTTIVRHMAEEVSCKGVRVLVVEDNVSNQMLIQDYFDVLGCSTDYVNHGLEAVNTLRAERDTYDVVLMDMQMPVMGGVEATQIIRREINPDVPIIALTAAVMDEDRKKAEAAGMNDFLAKPVDMMDLRKMILKHVKK